MCLASCALCVSKWSSEAVFLSDGFGFGKDEIVHHNNIAIHGLVQERRVKADFVAALAHIAAIGFAFILVHAFELVLVVIGTHEASLAIGVAVAIELALSKATQGVGSNLWLPKFEDVC